MAKVLTVDQPNPIFIIFENMSSIKSIESKIDQLSPALMDELEAYLDYLMSKRTATRTAKKLKQNWAGGLGDVKMSAIELQKKALDWRGK